MNKKKKELTQLGIFKGQVVVEYGDVWHDNHTFEQTEIQERALIRTINEMTENLKNAEIIEETSINIEIGVGAFIFGKMIFNGDTTDVEEFSVKLVGNSNPNDMDEITLNSPMGKDILGKKVGETVKYNVNDNVIEVTIEKIQY